MKFGVVVFPGSNCDHDMQHVLEQVMHAEVHMLWHKERDLPGFTSDDCIVLPGGFSYGDYLRAGAIARFSPIMQSVVEFAREGGLVFGICNGFQILCEARLLPGALVRNKNQRFISKTVSLHVENADTALTRAVPAGKVLEMPVAHAEGRFVIDDEGLEALEANNQVVFRYCDALGMVNDEANINGSLNNIAGITNEAGNVFGMMPHPERASEGALGGTDGRFLFESLVQSRVTAQVSV
ncbi:MAG: phosphoribosylformylglycinamidine synthase subunit PurQ [Saprospiraceae bacterium]|nr:phosphoribosylformylglycinamidine synthase subunit PurQ [Saprospiraceae bacterium]